MRDVHGHEWFGRICKVCGTTSDRAAAVRHCAGPVRLSSTASNTDADEAPAFTMPTFDPSPFEPLSFDSTPDSSPSVDTSFDAGFSGGDSGGGGGGSDF